MDMTASRDTLLRRSAYIGLALAALGAVALMPAPAARAAGPLSTHIAIDDDGFEATLKRPGYRLDLELDGVATFTADESDLATLSAGGEFELAEKVAGEQHRYTVEADRAGSLTREYARGGTVMPIDASGRAWLAVALQRAFRDAGLDAGARAARLLARGPDVLLDEVARIESDWVRSAYLRVAFASPTLDDSGADRAYQLARAIGSDFELRRALAASLEAPRFDAARADALLETARGIGSDFELAELLIAVAPRLPAGASTVAAWRTAVTAVQSDFEMRRAIGAAFADAPADYRRAALEAAAGIGSDFELRSALETGAKVTARDPVLVAAYLASAKAIGSDFEMRVALAAIAPQLARDPALLGLYLDRVEQMGSDFEQRNALTAVAPQLTQGSDASKRYLAIARGMSDFERGEALTALVDARAL